MANRSYLYSTNVIPGSAVQKENRRQLGISEWNYDIPLVYKLLLSGQTRACRSSIWESPGEIAALGDYAQGLARLEGFLAEIVHPAARPLVAEALEFLTRDRNHNPYFLLECVEICEMSNDPVVDQNAGLIDEINNLEPEILHARSVLSALSTKRQNAFLKLVGAKENSGVHAIDPLEPIRDLGLGNWSNVLYFHFDDA